MKKNNFRVFLTIFTALALSLGLLPAWAQECVGVCSQAQTYRSHIIQGERAAQQQQNGQAGNYAPPPSRADREVQRIERDAAAANAAAQPFINRINSAYAEAMSHDIPAMIQEVITATRWGAFALSQRTGSTGFLHKPTEDAAKQGALMACNQDDCQVMTSFTDTCYAASKGIMAAGNPYFALGLSQDKARATQQSLQRCRKSAKQCTVYKEDCIGEALRHLQHPSPGQAPASGAVNAQPAVASDAPIANSKAPNRYMGVIAFAAQERKLGGAEGKFTGNKDQDNGIAMAALQKCGHANCKIVKTYFNSCLAAVYGETNAKEPYDYFAVGANAPEAAAQAMQNCQKNAGNLCQVYYQKCAKE